MFWIISTIVIAGLVLVCLRVLPGFFDPQRQHLSARARKQAIEAGTVGDPVTKGIRSRGTMFGRIAAGILVAIWLVITALSAIHPVRSGEVGVVSRFGQIVGQRAEGLAVIAPWETIQPVSIRTQRATFEGLTAASSETQDVMMTVTVNYSVSGSAVQRLIRDVGHNWFNVLMTPRVTNFVKEIAASYKTVDIIPAREEIRTKVRERLARDLEPYSITVSDLLIDNIDFQQEFKLAIEQKQIATENARQERERIASAQAQAEQTRVRAQGEADAAVIAAQGHADSTKIQAEAQAAANEMLAKSLTPEVLQYQAITEMGDNVNIALIPSGQGVILDPTTLLGSTPPATSPAPDESAG